MHVTEKKNPRDWCSGYKYFSTLKTRTYTIFSRLFQYLLKHTPKIRFSPKYNKIIKDKNLKVGSIFFEMNVNTFGDLQNPAPLGLESVHVSLEQESGSRVTPTRRTTGWRSVSPNRHISLIKL